MTKEEFIQKHQVAIDAAINAAIYRHDGNGGPGTIPDPPPVYDDDEREVWLDNDEGLYNWARSEGVDMVPE